MGLNLKKFPINKNWLLAALSLVLILESMVLASWLKDRKMSVDTQPRGAVLQLEPNQGNFEVGKEFTVKVLLDTGEYETDATDVRLSYDPLVLEGVKIEPGTIYDAYPTKRFSQDDGAVIIYGITSVSTTFKGVGEFAQVTFKAKKPGKTNLIFEYVPESTKDSNVVATKLAKDILSRVEGATIEIN